MQGLDGRRTDGGRLDHVPDGESLDRLVLGCASRAVGATDGLDVATTVLVATAVVMLVILSPQNMVCDVAYLDARFLTMMGCFYVLLVEWSFRYVNSVRTEEGSRRQLLGLQRFEVPDGLRFPTGEFRSCLLCADLSV